MRGSVPWMLLPSRTEQSNLTSRRPRAPSAERVRREKNLLCTGGILVHLSAKRNHVSSKGRWKRSGTGREVHFCKALTPRSSIWRLQLVRVPRLLHKANGRGRGDEPSLGNWAWQDATLRCRLLRHLTAQKDLRRSGLRFIYRRIAGTRRLWGVGRRRVTGSDMNGIVGD